MRGAQAAPVETPSRPPHPGLRERCRPRVEVVRQRRGGGEWAGRPAADLEPHACPLLPHQHPLHRCRSTAEPGLEPTPQRALSSHEFSSLIRSLTHSQGEESQSSDARVGKCPVWVPHFEGPPHKEKRPGPSSRSLVYVLPPCRHGLSSSSRGRETPGRATRFPCSTAPVSAASRRSGWKRWASLISCPGACGTRG